MKLDIGRLFDLESTLKNLNDCEYFLAGRWKLVAFNDFRITNSLYGSWIHHILATNQHVGLAEDISDHRPMY